MKLYSFFRSGTSHRLRIALKSAWQWKQQTGMSLGHMVDVLRRAIREEKKLDLAYADAEGRVSRRVVWPIALAFFERVRILVAWCELRDGFRHFRLDRMSEARLVEVRYPRRRRALVRDWRVAQGVGPAA